MGWLITQMMRPFVDLRTIDFDVLQQTERVLVIANHRTMFDAVALLAGFHRVGRYPRPLINARYVNMPVLGAVLRSLGWVSVDKADLHPTFTQVNELNDAGIPLLVTPEGRLGGRPGDPLSLSKFHTGAARIAHACATPVWCFAHVGIDPVWPRGTRIPRLNPLRRQLVVAVGASEVRTMTGDAAVDTDMLHEWTRELLAAAADRHDEIRRTAASSRRSPRGRTRRATRSRPDSAR